MAGFSLAGVSAVYLRIANATFGGGDPTMAALHNELVHVRNWLRSEDSGLVFGLARLTPGTNMLAYCAGTAWRIAGWPAAALAVLAATLPSAVLVTLLTAGYEGWKNNPRAMAAIGGMLTAAVGMMAAGAWQLLRPNLARGTRLRALVIASGALALSYLGVTPVQVL